MCVNMKLLYIVLLECLCLPSSVFIVVNFALYFFIIAYVLRIQLF